MIVLHLFVMFPEVRELSTELHSLCENFAEMLPNVCDLISEIIARDLHKLDLTFTSVPAELIGEIFA
jgi:hypothetical protein